MTEFKAAPIEYAPRTHSPPTVPRPPGRRYSHHGPSGPTSPRPVPAAAGTRTLPRAAASPTAPRQDKARS
nr:hypothetical protein StreXyl84_12860 [Streptomyces sp. Xyl84]